MPRPNAPRQKPSNPLNLEKLEDRSLPGEGLLSVLAAGLVAEQSVRTLPPIPPPPMSQIDLVDLSSTSTPPEVDPASAQTPPPPAAPAEQPLISTTTIDTTFIAFDEFGLMSSVQIGALLDSPAPTPSTALAQEPASTNADGGDGSGTNTTTQVPPSGDGTTTPGDGSSSVPTQPMPPPDGQGDPGSSTDPMQSPLAVDAGSEQSDTHEEDAKDKTDSHKIEVTIDKVKHGTIDVTVLVNRGEVKATFTSVKKLEEFKKDVGVTGNLNWYQTATITLPKDKKMHLYGAYANGTETDPAKGKALPAGTPFVDPPSGGLKYVNRDPSVKEDTKKIEWTPQGWRDNRPWYYDEVKAPKELADYASDDMHVTNVTKESSLDFDDGPEGYWPETTITFNTWLVGTDKDGKNPKWFGGFSWQFEYTKGGESKAKWLKELQPGVAPAKEYYDDLIKDFYK